MRWIEKIKSKYRWSWVGNARGVCDWTYKGVKGHTDLVYWSLYIRGDGKRRADVTGDPKWSSSPNVTSTHAAVKAWVKGGPLPTLVQSVSAPNPKPPARLISFPGGKGGAA